MKNRNPYFDNAKAILIYLVVLGHLLSEFIFKDDTSSKIYMFIYLFHMPAFIIISGYFSKGVHRKGYILKQAKTLLIPYAVFQIIYTIYYIYVYGDNITFSMIIPRWGLWFLLSLFCWYVMLYFFSKFRYGFLFAIFLSLLIGYDSKVDDILSLSRTFFFFPFFMLGYLLEERHIFFFKKKKVRIVSIGILFVFIALIQLQVITTSDKELLLGKHSYNALGISWITRLFVYLVSTITSLSFLSLIPSKRYFFTSIGEKTLAIYLFHLFLVKAIHGSVLYDLIVDYQYFWILYFIPIFIVYLLSRKIFISISHFH